MRASRLSLAALTTAALLAAGSTSPAAAGAAPPDQTVPSLTIGARGWDTVFPAVDRYRDTTEVTYTVTDAADATVEVRVVVADPAGHVLGEQVRQAVPTGAATGFVWDGTDLAGGALRAGRYTLTFTATDAAGNTSAADSVDVAVDEGRLVTRTFKGSIGAKRSVVREDVRRCGALVSPVRGWRGSLGYYANKRCRRTGVASTAATVNGLYVPRAFEDADRGAFYKKVSVRTWGGNARQRPGAEAVLQYWDHAAQAWVAPRTMGSRLGDHAGATRAAKPVVVPGEDRPYVIWSLLTANGHWYDAKKFTVVLTYQVMQQPAVEPARTGDRPGAGAAPTGVRATAPTLP